jgi:hypothetical protein
MGLLVSPIWKYILTGDSVLKVALPPTITGLCLVLTVPWFFWQKVLVGNSWDNKLVAGQLPSSNDVSTEEKNLHAMPSEDITY